MENVNPSSDFFTFSDFQIEQEFLDFLRANDLAPAENFSLKIDGKLHRYRLYDDKPGERSGAYIVHNDGLPAGFVQDWKRGTKLTWHVDITKLTDEKRAFFNSEKVKRANIRESQKRAILIDRQKKHAAENALAVWNILLPAQFDHSYLSRKNINNYGLHFNRFNNCLAVPLRDIKGNVKSIQWIPADETQYKKFFEGASLEGLFWSIALDTLKSNPKQTILIGEGYATMAKVYELTSLPCVAALSCYRLREIATIIKKTYPNNKIIFTADNDLKTENERGYNPGIKYATEAANSGLGEGASQVGR